MHHSIALVPYVFFFNAAHMESLSDLCNLEEFLSTVCGIMEYIPEVKKFGKFLLSPTANATKSVRT